MGPPSNAQQAGDRIADPPRALALAVLFAALDERQPRHEQASGRRWLLSGCAAVRLWCAVADVDVAALQDAVRCRVAWNRHTA